jgi:hypothetical protein
MSSMSLKKYISQVPRLFQTCGKFIQVEKREFVEEEKENHRTIFTFKNIKTIDPIF